MDSPHILLFGDQLVEKLPSVRELYAISRTRPTLRRFLREATDVVQSALTLLTSQERREFGNFSDLLELAEQYQTSTYPDETVGAVLITATQVGEYLVLAEDDHSTLQGHANKVFPLGFCVGLLAASVAAIAQDTNDIVRYGLEAVAISFRLGSALKRRARSIEDSAESWGCTLVGPGPQDIQDKLEHLNDTLPLLRHAYLGVATQAWSTVFGPPSTLDLLAANDQFSDVPQSRLSAAISVHAEHLPPLDIGQIVGDARVLDAGVSAETLLSSSTCKPFQSTSMRDMLHQIIEDIAHRPLWLEETVKALGSKVRGENGVTLTTVGPTPHTSFVEKVLQQSCGVVHLGQSPQAAAAVQHSRGGSDLIAIVGMSGRFPGSDNINEFWELLQAGATTHEEIPASRFAIDDFFDPTEEVHNAVLSRFGCFLKNPGDFDNRLFNVSPREALQMDPLQRMLLMTTYEALEMAGYAHDGSNSTHSSRIAAFFGQTTEDWRTINDQQGTDTHYLPCSNRAFAPGRLNHHFKWGGGYYSIDTACSSSSTSVHLACSSLIARECDTSVVGGGSLCMIPELYSGLGKGGFLSSTGGCKSFAEGADGYCRGEAVGVVVLKRLEDALRENDQVLAVIRGTARNSNAGSGSITHPGEAAQEALFARILRQSGLEPHDVGFIEMHGTGTQAGDRAEINTVRNVFARGRAADNPLHVGAVKANIGHSEAAAGVVSLIKTVLMLREGQIPPQPGWPFPLNGSFPSIDEANIRIADGHSRLLPWVKGDGKRKVMINGFDAAGGNTSMLIEDGPAPAVKDNDARTHHVVVCSGRTPSAHEANVERLREYLANHPDTDLASLAYTSTARRLHEAHRSAYVASSIDELVKRLETRVHGVAPASKAKGAPVVFAFTGQSSQYTAMGSTLYETSPRFRQLLDSYQALGDAQGQDRFIDIVNGAQDVLTASATQIQVAIVALEIAIASYWRTLGLEPALVIGHSLGEYAALCVSGVLSVSDTLYLVHERAVLMQERCTPNSCAMLAIPLATEDVRSTLQNTSSGCEVSCINGPSSTVVSGPLEHIQELKSTFKSQRHVDSIILQVQYGFHSEQMDSVLDSYQAIAEQARFGAPKVPVASTLLGELVRGPGIFNATYLKRQMREPVNFLGAVEICEREGHIGDTSVVLEVGPHPVCTGLISSSLQEVQPETFASLRRGQDDCRSIATVLAGAYMAKLPIDWQEVHKDHLQSLQLLHLPSYAFDLKTYWVPYQSPSHQAVEIPVQVPPALTALQTTCLQYLASMDADEGSMTATFESKTAEPNLFKAIQGHLVDGVGITPASVFGDMAYSAAIYILQESGVEADRSSLELLNLEMKHALVVQSRDLEQTVRVRAHLDREQASVAVSFSSSSGNAKTEHATCRVQLVPQDSSTLMDWNRMQRLVKGRVRDLEDLAGKGAAHRMHKTLVYRLFASLVDYDVVYQSIEDLYVSSSFEDAAGKIKLGQTAGLGTFSCSPFAVDALVHLAGFMLNANLAKPVDDLHIANHLGHLHVWGDLSPGKECICYASIREQSSKGLTICDVYVYDDDSLIAVCTDIRFQKMSRDIFATMIGKDEFVPTKSSSPQQIAGRLGLQPQTNDSDNCSSSASDLDSSSDTSGYQASSVTSADTFDLSGALLNAVASRTGVSRGEMDPSLSFSDMGVDSPMSIAIISDFRKQTGVELPAAFFSSNPTPADVVNELGSMPTDVQEPAVKKSQKPARAKLSSTAQPEQAAQAAASIPSTAKPLTSKDARGSDGETLLGITAHELGVDVTELSPSTDFASLGVDSMLSIKVLSTFKKQTGVELPAAFFHSNPTVADVREELDGSIPMSVSEAHPKTQAAAPKSKTAAKAVPAKQVPKGAAVVAKHSSAPATSKQAPKTNGTAPKMIGSPRGINSPSPKHNGAPLPSAKAITPEAEPESRTILIQGKSRSTDAPLFLATDGSGAVSAYIHLPPLPGGRKIYAMESPFLECPEDYTLTVQEMAEIFIKSIRKLQPQGPYLIGGWSAGSIYAYEICYRLVMQGEKINGLIIMDMRVPHSVPDAEIVTMAFVEKTGAFTGVNRASNFLHGLSDKQKMHLTSTVRALIRYDPLPFPKGREPAETCLIWATKGLNDSPNPEEHDDRIVGPAAMGPAGDGKPLTEMTMEEFEIELKSWFFAKRYHFETNGWEDFVGNNIKVKKIDGDHFSMVAPPVVKDLGTIVLDAMASFVKYE